jgi:hypothetical protein
VSEDEGIRVMTKLGKFSAALAASFLCAALATPAAAQTNVRAAVYRGTLVCGKLPFIEDPVRAAIEIKIAGNAAQYRRPVRAPRRGSVAGTETGTGIIDGDKISLKGEWRGDISSYEATYAGTFVRRSARLTGTQTWTYAGKSYKRECSGVIKRPLVAFLPKDKKKAGQ